MTPEKYPATLTLEEQERRGITSREDPLFALTPEERNRLTDSEKAADLTLDEKLQGLTVAEKQRQAELARAHVVNADPHHVINIKARLDWESEQQLRAAHLAENPQHHTTVDNNPMKVMVYVNRTSHSVPPGPITVADFKRITKLTGSQVSMNGRVLGDEAEELRLDGGEVFFSH